MYVVERVYDDENKKKTNRTKGCARLFCTQLETQSNRIEHIRSTRSSRKNKCQTKHAHTIYICVKLLLKYFKSTHTHIHTANAHKLASNQD